MASCSPCAARAAQLSPRRLRWKAWVLLLGLGLVFTACGGSSSPTSTSMKVGVDSLQSADAWVRSYFRSSPLRATNASGAETTLDRFFIHSLGHYVGRQIHGEDTGWSSRSPIEVGQVLTIEPGLYIPSEGIGIRIEDTFLVTPTGLQCLTCAAPK